MGIKNLLYGAAVIAVSATVASVTTYKVIEKSNISAVKDVKSVDVPMQKAAFARVAVPAERVDLTEAADRSVHAVVHIKSTQNSKTQTIRRAPDIYDFFFGDGMGI